ncbi:hypothetical protein [Fulvimonas soli]|jgi:hypothetical protein|uniref:Nitrogen fixation protein FixH n=1 Tax=Fulvimonas soli TaxID=155197 RepID=A0A316HPT8_9GAMM|nr:hypothetical protein [Fulvimonas soli]PWK82375.1 hypothetical protein C7456_11621 [Fulvimonas soli]TNY26959.1 hypothetical protein BV497_06190 [Fulvimonas soli]
MNDGTRSAWREPMVWMLVGLPLASVAIGFGLLFAAVRPGRQDMESADRVTRWGRLQVSAQVRPDAEPRPAPALILRAKGDAIEAVPTDPRFPRGGRLTLILSAPDAAGGTRTYHLEPSELGWRGPGPLDGARAWTVRLSSDSASWLMRGRWTPQARFVRLVP